MSDELTNLNADMNFYTLVPEHGLCLIGDAIINLRTVSLIRKADGKTLLYLPGAAEPVALPESAFANIREAVFAVDDLDGEEDFDEEEEG